MKVKLVKRGNELETILSKLKRVDGENVKIGWFKEQGLHHSGLTFPRLVAIHHNGINVPKRPILSVVANLRSPPKNNQHIKKILRNFLRNISSVQPESVLEELGKHYVRTIKSYFGSSYLSPTENNPDPLIDTGELKRNTAYKTSLSNKVELLKK